MGFHDPVWTVKKYNADGTLRYLRNYYRPNINWWGLVGIVAASSPLILAIVAGVAWFTWG